MLLLYNMFGLATAILLFDDQYKTSSASTSSDQFDILKVYMPSLPYSSDWENHDGFEGLIKANGQFYNATHVKHANDTLYVTVKSNQAARDHFFELANKMQSMADQAAQTPENSREKAIKVLDNFLKNYLQNKPLYNLFQQAVTNEQGLAIFPSKQISLVFWITQLQTPPPETAAFS
ncbi:hypothetical protein SAMN04487995_0610 [Dyadobacter koreensis]|uniref:Uncharacterized protein n=2 Tax=Dyadobacter koreensis TaxID=408657 RepID=A0A1H6QFJ0_9BACT|nr:hypothetical protein SAMN04487995_0610 [Dyadobacter koreensis]